ncbi:MAG: substrate-binding domain-containing protein [Butyrivibrio sp.]|nr:substrate-binding domain-containing protein [Butyrivibrio sp.]
MPSNRKRKKIVCLWLVLIMALALVACGSIKRQHAWNPKRNGELIKVGIVNVNPNESSYRAANVADLQKRFTEERGYDASFAYSMDNEEQKQMAEDMIDGGVYYLLLAAADTEGWTEVLEKAKEKGVRVILFDRTIDADESLYEASVVSDMLVEGQMAVDWLAEQGLIKYRILHLQGALGSAAQKGRTEALKEKVDSSFNWKIAIQRSADWDEGKAKEIVAEAIKSGTTFNVIYSENDNMTRGAVAALDEAGITHGPGKDVIIISFDCNTWAMDEVLRQNWNYIGQCNPYQATYIDEIIKTIESGGRLADKTIILKEKGFDAEHITKDDIDNYGI